MITFYAYPGPNVRKVAIMLEEIAAPYEVAIIDITKGEQFKPDFLKISPNNKLPAILDRDTPQGPQAVFETGAILMYLAEKSGRFLPAAGPRRAEAYSWLLWGLTGIGANFPQLHYFGDRADTTPAPILDRFADETVRLFKVLEARLSAHEYLAQEYSIADMPTYASVLGMLATVRKFRGTQIGATPSIDRWIKAIGARPAVQRGMAVPKV